MSLKANEDSAMSWKLIEPEEGFFEGGDVYSQWIMGAGEPDFFPPGPHDEWMPVLLRLAGMTARDFAAGTEFGIDRWKDLIYVSDMYTKSAEELQAAEYCTALVKYEFFEILKRTQRLRSRIARLALHPPVTSFSGPDEDSLSGPDEDSDEPDVRQAARLNGAPEHGTVVIGIIDDGIAFAHARFRSAPDKTRVEYVWLQDGGCDPPPSRVPYGSELHKAKIDSLLRACAPAGFVDEDDLYRRAGVVDFGRPGRKSVARRAAHGTHVLDLACGEKPADARNDRPIVCVQLPTATTADTSGISLDAYALDGMRYILDRADDIARARSCGRLPVVVNFSYGHVAGPHDGTSDLEAAIDELVRERKKVAPLEVVLPSGNSHLARLHARVCFDKRTKTVDLHWRVLPDDGTPSFMEIWLPHGRRPTDPSRIKLSIKPPWGELSEPPLEEKPGRGLQWAPHGEVLCEARYRHVREPTDRGMFLIALQPTTRLEPAAPGSPAKPVAPSGTWTVRLENSGASDSLVVRAWIQRDDTPYGFRRRGRQSYFDEPCYVRFDAQGRLIEEDTHPEQLQQPCHVKRAGSINALATGERTIVVGGIRRKEMLAAPYSGGGPITPREGLNRKGPDVMAISDESAVRRGVPAAGTRSGSVVALDGTSVAAPQIARLVAGELAASRPGGRDAIAAIARQREASYADTVPEAPSPERGGAGRIVEPPVVAATRNR